jgi:hypothetical protein
MNLIAYAQISGQSGETISIRAFPDHAALQARMRILHSGKGSEYEFVAFSR